MKALATATRIIFGFIVALLWIRFAMQLFGIRSSSSFVTEFFDLSSIFLVPFGHMFSPMVMGGKYVIEITTLFAIVIYEVIKFILVKLFHFIGGHHY
jgi:hypothetical protein